MLDVRNKAQNSSGKRFSYRRTFVNLLSQWVATVAMTLISLYLVAYLANKLGKDLYGAWAGVMSMTSFLMLLDSGLFSAVQQHVAVAHKSDDFAAHRRTYTAASMLYAVLAIVAVAGGYVLARYYARIFPGVPAAIATAIRPSIVWAGVSVGLTLLSVPANGFLLGTQRFAPGNFFKILRPVVMLIFLAVMFPWKGVQPIYLGQSLAASSLVTLIGTEAIVWICWPGAVRPSLEGIKEELKSLFSFTSYSMTWTLAQMVIYRASPLFALWFLAPADAAYAYITTNVIQTARGFVVTGCAIAAPMSAALPKEQLRPLVLRGTRTTTLFAAVIAAFALVYGQTFFSLWIKKSDISSAFLFRVFAFGLIASLPEWWGSMLSVVLVGGRQLRAETKVIITSVVLTLAAGFVGVWLCGVTGLVAGLALGNSLACCVGYAAALSGYLKLPIRQLLMDTIPVNVALCTGIILVGMCGLHVYHPTSWFGLIVHALVVFVLLLPALWQWGLDGGLRAKVPVWRLVSTAAR